MPHLVAPFTVVARPPADDPDAGQSPVLGLTVFDKVFAGGGLLGTSVVRMVSTGTEAGPLAYVALERVEGEVDGRSGAFVLRHVGAVTGTGLSLELAVVEGSATGALVGLSATGTIEHTADGARLELDYSLPD